jgi:hypothetical protein
MMRDKRWLAAIAAMAVLAVAGCGEKASVTVYKQGQYQGKPDNRPWDSEQFKGDKLVWEKAIKARNNGQNEYARVAK